MTMTSWSAAAGSRDLDRRESLNRWTVSGFNAPTNHPRFDLSRKGLEFGRGKGQSAWIPEMSGHAKTNCGEERLMDIVARCHLDLISVEAGS
jgi:hypothetical protein